MLIGHSMADANGVILAADEAVCDLLGRSNRDLVGRNYIDLTHPADRARNRARVEGLRPQEWPATIRKRYVRPQGEIVWADVTISRLEGGADAGRLLGTLSPSAGTEVPPFRLWRTATELARFDDVRRELIGADLCGDHSWLILLHMYLAEAEGRIADAPQVAAETGLAEPVVARWLAALRDRDLVEANLGGDGLQLTVQAIVTLEKVLTAYESGWARSDEQPVAG